MLVGKKIEGHKELTKNIDLNKYLNPSIIYIPLINGNDDDVTVVVKKDDYVYKDMMLAKTKGNFRITINSSVSGTVLGIEDKYYLNGKRIKCLAIKNDFKEKSQNTDGLVKEINKYTKEEFLQILESCGIVGMGGGSFPTYAKYKTQTKIKTLIVNAVECEPYITADYKMIENNIEHILEAIDAIMTINDIDECIFAVKRNNQELIKKINTFIGTYISIKLYLVPNIYPMGWERTLIKKVKHVNYDKLPIEKNIVVNNVSTIYYIYEALKYHKCITERIVTFSGDMLKNPQNILVKIGTNISDIIDDTLKLKTTDYNLVAGGPMMGNFIDNTDLVISPNLNCVLITKKENNDISKRCLRCGKCSKVCPALLAPVLIKDSINNTSELKILKADRCVECGLCSYICPAKINVREFVKLAKKNMKEGK